MPRITCGGDRVKVPSVSLRPLAPVISALVMSMPNNPLFPVAGGVDRRTRHPGVRCSLGSGR